MADQNTILKLLAKADGVMTIVDLVKAAPKGGATAKAHRASVLQAAAGLVEKKFAIALIGDHARDYDGAAWHVTPAGITFHKSGKPITSGQSNLNVARKPTEGSLRDRLWRAFRIKKRGTIPQLVAMVRNSSDGDNVSRNAQAFMQALVKAGVALQLKQRAKGVVPGSNGHKQFMLDRDLGVVPPVAHRDFLFDPNTTTRIPYEVKP